VLRNCRIEDVGPLQDIGLRDGRIGALTPHLPRRGRQEWDLGGSVVLPATVNAHIHLDKTLLASWDWNPSGTLLGAIDAWGSIRRELTRENFLERGAQAISMVVTTGTTALRTHVGVGGPEGLVAVKALLERKARFQEMVDLQVFVSGRPEFMEEDEPAVQWALEAGADGVGGAPALAPNPRIVVDSVLWLGEEFGKPVDLHVDETDDPSMLSLEYLAE
jgi:cytosine deaminase